MTRNNVINMIWIQVLWFAAVLGAANDIPWLAPILLVLFILWQSRVGARAYGDFRMILVTLLLGFVLDTTWINLGWMAYAADWPEHDWAPLWILVLWSGLALTLNHSLAWLQSRLLLAGMLAGLVGPFSYLAAERLGALTINASSWTWALGLGISWALALPTLLWLAGQLNEIRTKERQDV